MIAVSIIASAVQKELGSYFSTEAHTHSDIIRYINSAVRAITIARNFDFNQYSHKIDVISWTDTYSIPYQIETFFVKKSWQKVDFYDFKNYNILDHKNDIVWIWGNNFKCTSPWEYEIFYRGFPKHITSLNDFLEIPEHFYDLILLKSTYFGFMDIRAYDKANNKENIFNWMVKNMATRSSNPKPMQIKRLNKWKKKVW